MTRTEEETRRIYAEPDDAEREESILFRLALGATCDEIVKNARERSFCEAMKPDVDDLLARGIAISTEICRTEREPYADVSATPR